MLQDDLQCKYTGGTVLHLYMGERLSSPEACRNFVRTVISNFKLPYITVTQGVVLSGGECTMHPSIVKLLEEIKQMGFAIKIDTNGSRPQTLHTLISKGLVDYVALDFKALPDKYWFLTGSELFSEFETSLALLLASGPIPVI